MKKVVHRILVFFLYFPRIKQESHALPKKVKMCLGAKNKKINFIIEDKKLMKLEESAIQGQAAEDL